MIAEHWDDPPGPWWSWNVPEGGLTAADLDRMPGLPAHTELIDGGLFFMSPQTRFHQETMLLLQLGLRAHAPAHLVVIREMSVIAGERQRPEPDVSVVRADMIRDDREETSYQADAVVLAVEVVSPSSHDMDRRRKPVLYAQAGIAHFWRVEKSNGLPVVYVYELDPATSAYTPTGIFHDRLKVSVPFPIDIDLTDPGAP